VVVDGRQNLRGGAAVTERAASGSGGARGAAVAASASSAATAP